MIISKSKFLINKSINRQNIINSFWYLCIPAINFILSAITYPILTEYFKAEDFGIIGYYNSIITFYSVFYGLSFNTYYLSVYNTLNDTERKTLVNKLIIALLLWNLIIVPLSIITLVLFINKYSAGIPALPFSIMAVLYTSISVFKSFLQIDLRLKKKAFYYFLITSGSKLLGLIFTIIFTIYIYQNARSHFWGLLLTECFFMLIVIYYYKTNTRDKLDIELTKKVIKVTWPLVFASLCYIPCLSYDMVIAEQLNNKSELGVFSVGKNMGMYLYTIGFAFYQVIEPGLYKAVAKAERQKIIILQVAILIVLAILYLLLYYMLPYLIKYLTHDKLAGSLIYARITLLMAFCMVFFSSSDAILTALQKNRTIFWIHLSAACLCLILHPISSKYYSYEGIGYTNVLVFFYITLMSTLFAWRNLIKSN